MNSAFVWIRLVKPIVFVLAVVIVLVVTRCADYLERKNASGYDHDDTTITTPG